MIAKINGKERDIELVSKDGNRVSLKIDGKPVDVDVTLSEKGFCSILHDGHSYNAEIVRDNDSDYIITTDFKRFDISLSRPRKKYIRPGEVDDDELQESILAPMPGKIVNVLVVPGTKVHKGDPLLIIEAMKMQSTYSASQDATVENVAVKDGDTVLTNQLLISFQRTDNNEQ